MPTPNKTMIDAGLKKAGFGGLNDPTLFDQIAFVVSGKGPLDGHRRFRSMLLSVEPEQRRVAYQAIAPKLRFKAKPLEDYEIEGAERADQMRLPSYDPKTLEVKEWSPQTIETQEFKEKQEQEQERQTSLEKYASSLIAQNLRESGAKIQLTISCEQCTRERSWRAKRRKSCLVLASQEGWKIKDWRKAERTLCPACVPKN